MKRVFRVDLGETLSVGGYQSIKPALSESIEYNDQDYTEAEEEMFRDGFKEKVRQEYFKLKEQMLTDFIAFAQQVQKIVIPVKK